MIDWLTAHKFGRYGQSERKYRWLLILAFKLVLIPLSMTGFFALLLLLALIVLLTVAHYQQPSTLFLISAETNRLSFEVTDTTRPAPFFVQGVEIVFEDKLIARVDQQKTSLKGDEQETIIKNDEKNTEGYCIEGWIEPQPGSRVELLTLNGMQAARIEGAQTLLSNATVQYVIEGQAETVTSRQENILLLNSDSPPPLPDPSSPQQLITANLIMDGTVQLRADPSCTLNDPEASHFAPRNEPIYIHGPGQIGRQLRNVGNELCMTGTAPCPGGDSLWVMEPDRAFLNGEIDMLAREILCWNRLSGQPCTGLFRLDADPVPIPAGASVAGGANRQDFAPTPLIGQVYFDNGLYVLDASTNASWMAVTFPSQPAKSLSYSELQLSLLDRLLVEAWIFVVATVALTLLGWVLSILQIELDRVPQHPNLSPKAPDQN